MTRYDCRKAGDWRSRRKRSRKTSRSSGLSDGMAKSSGIVSTASSMAAHTASGSLARTAPACWTNTCISVKHIPSELSPQKPRTRSARSSRPLNISARFGYRACMEGRAATERSQERSVASEGPALTVLPLGLVASSVIIGIGLY